MAQNIGKNYWANSVGGTSTALVATIPGLDSLKHGDVYIITTPLAIAAGPLTIDVNGLGAVPVKLPNSADIDVAMPANYEMLLTWNTSEFILNNPNKGSSGWYNAIQAFASVSTQTGGYVNFETFPSFNVTQGQLVTVDYVVEFNVGLATDLNFFVIGVDIGDGTGVHRFDAGADYKYDATESGIVHRYVGSASWIAGTTGTVSPIIKIDSYGGGAGTVAAGPHSNLNISWK